MLLFEFIVDGPPISQQTRRRDRLRAWKDTIRREAERYLSTSVPPINGLVEVTVIYFYVGVPLDTDNIIKPILDALIGLVYNNDDQVTDVVSRKRNLHSSFKITNLSPVLAEGFSRGNEFLYIRIDEAPNQEEFD